MVFWQEIANIGNIEPGGETSLKRERSQQQAITWFFSTLGPYDCRIYIWWISFLHFYLSRWMFCAVPCVFSILTAWFIFMAWCCVICPRDVRPNTRMTLGMHEITDNDTHTIRPILTQYWFRINIHFMQTEYYRIQRMIYSWMYFSQSIKFWRLLLCPSLA